MKLPRWGRIAGAGVLALVVAIGVCEALGWPFLEGPVQRFASSKLGRDVRFGPAAQTVGAADADATASSPARRSRDAGDPPGPVPAASGFHLRLLGGITLHVGQLTVANPPWRRVDPMLDARDITLKMRWRDVLGGGSGRPLRVDRLQADSLALRLEREPDGRASWQFGRRDDAVGQAATFDGVRLQRVLVREGTVALDDRLMQLRLDGDFRLADGRSPQAGGDGSAGIVARAQGSYRNFPVNASLRTGSVVGWLDGTPSDAVVPIRLEASVGRAKMTFRGEWAGEPAALGWRGRYTLSGPSLSVVGEPVKITLPTTRAFEMAGTLVHEGGGGQGRDERWLTVVDRASIGQSRLEGAFEFRPHAEPRPRLAGRLGGASLALRDLGITIGVPETPTAARAGGKVLPDRPLDLPSLRAMDADVAVALERLDIGSESFGDIRPLRARLHLADGRLEIDAIDARLAQGRLSGRLALDGRTDVARWDAELQLAGLRIEQWVRRQRAGGGGDVPYATGRLNARLKAQGRGRSTAQILASADGSATLLWTQGRLSHLVVEAAGLDIAQALGVMIRGDEALPVTCGAAEFTLKDGSFTPKVAVVDTRDSTLWADGKVSFASERLDLKVHVEPKDFSPLSLRAPLVVRGTLGDPSIGIDKAVLTRRIVPAALLAAISPLAALLPVLDPAEDAKTAMAACQTLSTRMQRGAVQPAAATKPAQVGTPRPGSQRSSRAASRP